MQTSLRCTPSTIRCPIVSAVSSISSKRNFWHCHPRTYLSNDGTSFAPEECLHCMGTYLHEVIHFVNSVLSHIRSNVSFIARRSKMSNAVARNKTNVTDTMRRRTDWKTQHFRKHESDAIGCHDFNFARFLISYRSYLFQNFAQRNLIHLRSNKHSLASNSRCIHSSSDTSVQECRHWWIHMVDLLPRYLSSHIGFCYLYRR